MYLDHTFAPSLSEITSLFGLSSYLDRTFAQRIGSAKVKSKSEVTHCNLRLIDNIEQIGHSDANIEWSSDEDLDWLSGIKTALELFRILFYMFRTSQQYESHYSLVLKAGFPSNEKHATQVTQLT